ncbi:hypothetical protein EZS27_003683 [termite gut metagenome]|uniref:Outer membrane protein beta-barrel domain-containing protein n=1 Tax=termite gut metagenome TaxID=433724 RepID=A0A5J4SUC1_9ZZZZ
MKKIIFSLILAIGSICMVNAQDNAIGLRLGYSAEASFQHALSSANRLEADLGLNFGKDNGLNLSGTYQWVWDLSALSQGFNWYAGVGAGLGIWDKEFALGVIGQVGIEYHFDIPLQVSLDYRPGIWFIPDVAGPGGEIALGVRYKF